MINLAQDLKPISYIKAHTTEIVKYVGDSKTPVVITHENAKKIFEKTLARPCSH